MGSADIGWLSDSGQMKTSMTIKIADKYSGGLRHAAILPPVPDVHPTVTTRPNTLSSRYTAMILVKKGGLTLWRYNSLNAVLSRKYRLIANSPRFPMLFELRLI